MTETSILKLDNFIHKIGGIEHLYEVRDQFNAGHHQREVAKRWGFSPGQFCEYFNNTFQLVAIERPEAKAHVQWLLMQQQASTERDDERIREATRVLRLVQSGDKRIEETVRALLGCVLVPSVYGSLLILAGA